MIKTRKLACGVLCAAFSLGTYSLSAQQPALPAGEMQPPSSASLPQGSLDSQVSALTQRYSLSSDQATQVRAILQDEQQRAFVIVTDKSLTPPDLSRKIASLKEDQIARISAIMTPEQRTKFETDVKQVSAPPQPSGFPPPPPGLQAGSPTS